MNKILLCQHGGSGNHGCEALARTVTGLLKKAYPDAAITLYSYNVVDDKKYMGDIKGLDIRGLYGLPGKLSPYNLMYHAKRVMGYSASKLPINQEFRSLAEDADLIIAIGGDNYCYNMGRGYWALDDYIRTTGKPYMLFGCSIEPEDLPRGLAVHLRPFKLITVRERITLDAMDANGLDNAVFAPDPAFLLDTEDSPLPDGLIPEKAVGINFSPLVIQNEGQGGMTLKAFTHLANYILENTDRQIALIPHVVWPDNDDRKALAALRSAIGTSDRVFTINDRPARQLKGIISRLDFFVGARTHATIAAYSTCVPTLTLGYSVKARGIARDLFGTEDGYVIPVQGLTREDQLTEGFSGLFARREEIRTHLSRVMPGYKASAESALEHIVKALSQSRQPAETTSGAPLRPYLDSVAGLIGKELCCGCGACSVVCPQGCISFEDDDEGFWQFTVDKERCTGCGICRRVCPAARRGQAAPAVAAWAAAAKDLGLLAASSSGGVFGVLAEDFIRGGGVVYGAAMGADMTLKHIRVETVDELAGLRGSKYLQSQSRAAIKDALAQLKQGRRVLFSGTTCQINAMALATPPQDRDRLLLVDVVCHGVPSGKVFGRYIQGLEAERGSKVTDVNFRDKITGWQEFSMTARFEDGGTRSRKLTEDEYMRLFMGNLSLRRSCNSCISKKSPLADITLADFWGIRYFAPKFDKSGGASMVIARTYAGRQAVEGLGDALNLQTVDITGAEKYNPCLVNPVPRPAGREQFFRKLAEGESIAALADEYAPIRKPSALSKVKKLIRR